MDDYPEMPCASTAMCTMPAIPVALDYEGRFLRRKRLVAASGRGFPWWEILPEVTNPDGR